MAMRACSTSAASRSAGLYAVGNDMASLFRGVYVGPGITLGPALVFAYRAVMDIASNARA